MRWRGRRKSNNVEDRRSVRVSGRGRSGGGGMLQLLPMVFKVLGFKGTVIAVVCLGAFSLFTGNLGNVLSGLGLQQTNSVSQSTEPLRETAAEKELVDFVSVILADTEETWTSIFQQKGLSYQEPQLVLFRGAVKSACGMAPDRTSLFVEI